MAEGHMAHGAGPLGAGAAGHRANPVVARVRLPGRLDGEARRGERPGCTGCRSGSHGSQRAAARMGRGGTGGKVKVLEHSPPGRVTVSWHVSLRPGASS